MPVHLHDVAARVDKLALATITNMEGMSVARELVNNLVYSQYEQFRAFLLGVAEKHPGLACEVLLSVLKIGGRIGGALWSHSIPSASHLSWMCLAEVYYLLDKSSGIEKHQRWTEIVEMSCAFESLVYLEEISRNLKLDSSRWVSCTEDDCHCYWNSRSEREHSRSPCLERDQLDHDSCRGDCLLVEDLGSEIFLVLRKLWHCEYAELGLGSEVVKEVQQGDLHAEVHAGHLMYADGNGIAVPIGERNTCEDTANDRSKRCKAAVMKLTLAFPELLSAYCRASSIFSMSPDPSLPLVKDSFFTKKSQISGNLFSNIESLKEVAKVELCAHSLVQSEVQNAHLQAIRQFVESRQLMKAARHLRYLNGSPSPPDSVLKDVVKFLFDEAANAGDEDGWLLSDGGSRRLDVLLFTELLGSGRTALCLAAEESRLHEETTMRGQANGSAILPLFTRLHKRLQSRLSDEKSVLTSGIQAPIAGYKSELLQHALVPVAHIFQSIVNAALSSIEGLLFNLAADVLSPFPNLWPLVVVMGWDLLCQKTVPRQNMLDILWTSRRGAAPAESRFQGIGCVGYICEVLGHQLEVARFLASVPVPWKPGTRKNAKSWCSSDINAPLNWGDDPNSGDSFIANLVLEHLGSYSPVRVLFQFLPDIYADHALHFLERQPVRSLGNSRGNDVELVQMYAGIGAATAALYVCKWESSSTCTESEMKGTDVFLAKMQKHMDSVCTPSRRLWMLDTILSLIRLEILEMDHNTVDRKCEPSARARRLATTYCETNASQVVSLLGELLTIIKKGVPADIPTTSNTSEHEEDKSFSILLQKVSQVDRLINDWGLRLKGLHQLCKGHLQWQRREALRMVHAAVPTIVNVYLQYKEFDLAREVMDRFDLSGEEVSSLEMSEWIKKVEDDLYREGEANAHPSTAFEAITGREPLTAISGAIFYLDFAIASAKLVQSSNILLSQAHKILMEVDKKILGQVKSFVATFMKQLLDRIAEFVEQGQAQSIQALLMPPNGGPDSRQGPKPRALLLLQQVIVDASSGKRQFLSGKLHNIVKALADDDFDDPGIRQEGPFIHRRYGQIPESEGGLGVGFAAIIGPSVSVQTVDQTGDNVLFPLKGRGRRWLSSLANKPAAFLSAVTLYIATIGDVVDGVDTTHDFNFFSLIRESPKDLLARLVFEQISLDAALKVAEVMDVELVQNVISVCVHPVYPPSAGSGWASISEAITSACVPGGTGVGTPRLWFDLMKHLMAVSPARAILVCIFGNNRSWLEKSGDLRQDQGYNMLEFTLEQSANYPILHRWVQIQMNVEQLSHVPSVQNCEKPAMKKPLKRAYNQQQELCTTGELHGMVKHTGDSSDSNRIEGWLDADSNERRRVITKRSFLVEPYQSNSAECNGVCKLSFDWENQQPCEDAAWRLVGEGKLLDALLLADRWLCGGASDSLLHLLVERREGSASQEKDWHSQPMYPNSSMNSWQYCIRLRNKNLAARLALRYHSCWELGAAIDVLTMCHCHLQPSEPLFQEVLARKTSLLQFRRIMQADSDFVRWQEVELLCQSDPEGLSLRLSGKGAVLEALDVAETFGLSAELQIELKGRQLVHIFGIGPADGGGPAAALKFLLTHSENGFLIVMAALEQLPNLHSKQLLVQFISKHHTGRLSMEDHKQVEDMAFGLRILEALPVPWQHRCSALYKRPKLIYETLLMWKQWHMALELLHAFPALEDDALVTAYAAKAINVSMPLNADMWVSAVPQSRKFSALARSSRLHLSLSHSQGESSFSVPCTSFERDLRVLQETDGEMYKCGGTLPPSHRAAWEAMAGPADEHVTGTVPEGYERIAPVTLAEDWVLTGDARRDEVVRNLHRFESAPCPILFKSLLLLCSRDEVAATAAVDLCVTQAKRVLGEEHLTFISSLESIERAVSAAGAFAQILQTAAGQLQNLVGAEKAPLSSYVNKASTSAGNFAETPDNLIDLLHYAQLWLGRIEVLQSLLESGVSASLMDILDEASATQLRDRLIAEERYHMAIITCAKCKVHAFPAWMAWGHALLRIGGYAEAREKFKNALQLDESDPASTVWEAIFTIEGGPPADVAAVNELYIHMVKNVYCSTDDSLSADAYLNVLHVPSFGKSDKGRWSCEDSPDILAGYLNPKGDDHVVRSHLDDTHFEECLLYLQEFCQKDVLVFSFEHGRYTQACQDALSVHGILQQMQNPSSSLQRPDWPTADYGSLDDLCDLVVGYAAIPVLEHVLGASLVISRNPDVENHAHTDAGVQRICNYCEGHRHFNHLYRFQLLKKDHVAAGLCQIQLFQISLAQDEAIRHLEQAKVHFDEGLAVKHTGEGVKSISKITRIRSPSEKLTEEELIKFTARVSIQIDVARNFSDVEGHPWQYSLFGNPNDGDTQRRRCEVVEILLDRSFDLAFKIIYEYNLPRTQIYAGFAAILAAKRRNHQLTEFFRNIKGTIGEDDLDQILGASISVYANKHRERPDRLIEMITSSHKKVLALVVCGRLKTALQVATRADSIADVQFIAHQARLTHASAVIDLCKQWLAQNQE